ncbi:MAG: RNA 2',3'-cyclic phosphodiesterase [Dermatophilus congolensis]|nr:RNA 2',3'-cyclic phosphodiesterase [Dermatophilus congolensis]
MRIFAALVPPEEVVEDLDEFLAPRRESTGSPGLRWAVPEQFHITLAFAGDARASDVEEAQEAIAAACRRRPPLDLRLAGAGAFPGPGHARALWVGVGDHDAQPFSPPETPAALSSLAEAVRTATRGAGIAAEGGAFRAHLTVARLGRPIDATKWLRVLETYRSVPWRADEVTLFASYLGQGRGGKPRHEELAVFSLHGAQGEHGQ